ncbi:hypothetical protein SG72_18970 [Enterobacter cloacae subsp. cloacae]|nr:hypothetical protein D1177_01475 [Enterobacter cloacae]KJX05985.1 hypothetical protein SG72_18970 [Enterobacter cloacae subsp. cloacae]KLQ13353.1 hypothetical protein ABR35_17950 [Enterobacter cloacae subsp. cloacae]OXL38762.1 hypothetical protein CA284_18330 [Enterobacter mori]
MPLLTPIKKPPADASGLGVVITKGFETLSQKMKVVCAILQLIAVLRFVRFGFTRHLAHLTNATQYYCKQLVTTSDISKI